MLDPDPDLMITDPKPIAHILPLFTVLFVAQNGMLAYVMKMMTSWAIVCDVWYLPPMTREEVPLPITFLIILPHPYRVLVMPFKSHWNLDP